jgi:hypothetical protein
MSVASPNCPIIMPTPKSAWATAPIYFLGAMDGGIDARKTYDRNFHGPFATISIGLGG